MKHLAQRDAAQRRVDQVVQRGVIGLAEVLPGAAAKRGDTGRLPEAQPVRAPGVEVVVALIRVADLVDDEIVQVPHPPLLHVGPPRLRGNPRGDLAAHEICRLVEDVDHRGGEERTAHTSPGTALAGAALAGPCVRISAATRVLSGRVVFDQGDGLIEEGFCRSGALRAERGATGKDRNERQARNGRPARHEPRLCHADNLVRPQGSIHSRGRAATRRLRKKSRRNQLALRADLQPGGGRCPQDTVGAVP